jgi:formylglycine-generating enzyme required for sulfatase activity
VNSRQLCCFLALMFLSISGCGTSLPEASKVRSQMAPEQIAIGEPEVNSVGMVLVPVPAGEYLRGTATPAAAEKEKSLPPGAESEQPQHSVQITKAFQISVCEVTQDQYQQVMNETPWKGQPLTREGGHIAATYVSREQAAGFCEKLSELENATYRLPTEAEWEYACRAGTTSNYSFGDDGEVLDGYAWFDQNSYKAGEQYAHAVGQKLPNAWSLYDMHGNVWEWCSDFHGSYGEQLKRSKGGKLVDPKGPESGWQHVWRGGGFSENGMNLRSASRNSFGRVDYRPEFMMGFRVVKEVP